MTDTDITADESVEEFRERARAWVEEHLPTWDEPALASRELQNRLFDAGFAGIAFPREYGGAGLTLEHHKAFYDLTTELDRQVPTAFMVSIGMLGPTLLDHGSHEAKLKFLPALLRGDEEWIQLLSEPRGGSDMAGAITRLTRDGDSFVLSGAKMWSTGAHRADYGLCLCRSDWDVPKHRGLSMIAVPLKDTPGVTIERTRSANGEAGEFCQEFFDDVVLPAENLIGELNGGWTVAQRLLFHERNAVGNVGYGYVGKPRVGGADEGGAGSYGAVSPRRLLRAAAARGVCDVVAVQLADAYVETVVGPLTSARIQRGMRVGTHQGQWGSLLKLQGAVSEHETARTALAALGADAVMWDGDDVQLTNAGTSWLTSRGGTIAGGTNEMQRNIISERLLGLPREPSSDRDVPFSEVMRNLGRS